MEKQKQKSKQQFRQQQATTSNETPKIELKIGRLIEGEVSAATIVRYTCNNEDSLQILTGKMRKTCTHIARTLREILFALALKSLDKEWHVNVGTRILERHTARFKRGRYELASNTSHITANMWQFSLLILLFFLKLHVLFHHF